MIQASSLKQMQHPIAHLPSLMDTYPKIVWEVQMGPEPRELHHIELSMYLRSCTPGLILQV